MCKGGGSEGRGRERGGEGINVCCGAETKRLLVRFLTCYYVLTASLSLSTKGIWGVTVQYFFNLNILCACRV